MIEIEDYVRTKIGIGRIIKIFEYDDGHKNYYTDVAIDDEDNTIILHRHQILKYSKNIIDLLEVGDIVDKSEVYEIGQSDDGQKWVHTYNGKLYYENELVRKTILIKENYEANCYTVERK